MTNLVDIALEIDQGDDEKILVTVVEPAEGDADPEAADLTDCTLRFAVRRSVAETGTPLISKSTGGNGITVDSPETEGKATIVINEDDTGQLPSSALGVTLRWQLEVDDASAEHNTTTLARGTLVINRDLVVA